MQARRDCGATERVPRAGAVIVRRHSRAARSRRASRSRSRARGRSGIRGRRPPPPARRPSHRRSCASSAGRTATPAWPFVSTWPSCASSASIVDAPAKAAPARPARRPSNRMRASRSRPRSCGGRVRAGDGRRLRPAAGRGDADQVEEAALRLRHDIGRQLAEREIAHERRDRDAHGSVRAAIALRHPRSALRH